MQCTSLTHYCEGHLMLMKLFLESSNLTVTKCTVCIVHIFLLSKINDNNGNNTKDECFRYETIYFEFGTVLKLLKQFLFGS
jgi:hypothetical protein